MTTHERDQLIDDLLDAAISDADFLRLEAELRVDPEARQSYYRRLKLNQALTIESGSLATESVAPEISFWSRHFQALATVAAVALFVLVGVSGWRVGQIGASKELADTEPQATGFAILSEHSDAIWLGREPLPRGDLVPQGPLRLGSGIAQLEFFSGVTVLIEGESEFEIQSPMEMKVTKGKVRALVPEAAHGFKVSTLNGDVIDLGTEFALEVSPEHSEMHVLQGEIEWHPKASGMHLLGAGDSMRWNEAEGSSRIEVDSGSFPRFEDIEQRFLNQKLERQNNWKLRAEQLRENPQVLAFYQIDEMDVRGRHLDNAAGPELNGTIVSARRVADRWDHPGSALNFSPAGSCVRVNIPGSYRSLTFFCWARIDSLDRMYNSLFLTDGHDLNEPHWQIMNDGRLFFSVKRRDKADKLNDKHIAYSPSFWDPSQSGKWFQITTVYDVDAQTTTHYVNGKVVSQDRIEDDYLVENVSIGAASIGNWNEPTRDDPQFALRNLNGAIDEFAIFTRALGADEIADLYNQGRP